jgi:hypothetical protein
MQRLMLVPSQSRNENVADRDLFGYDDNLAGTHR